MYSKDFKARALEVLRGRWGVMARIMLLAELIGVFFFLDIVYRYFFAVPRPLYLEGMPYYYIYYYPVGLGWLLLAVLFALRLLYGLTEVGAYRVAATLQAGETPRVRQLLPMNLFWKVLAMHLLRGVIVALWSLLLIAPGIIAVYRYAMADYLMAENPELGPMEALRESSRQMYGFKWRFFCLRFSFVGWLFLIRLILYFVSKALSYMGAAGDVVYSIICICMGVPLSIYILMAETLFFSWLRSGGAWRQASPEAEQAAYDAAPAEDQQKVFTDLSPDENVARDVYIRHGCSHARMREDGVWEEYQAMGISSFVEARWRREFVPELMRRFGYDADALDDILNLCAEYAMDDLADRALERIDRHIREESLPPLEILGMLGRMLAMLTSGAFAENAGYVSRKRAQILDMCDRLEKRLNNESPEGDWRALLEKIRQM